jgi:hypothetical protein
MAALKGMVVPCPFKEIEHRWERASLLAQIDRTAGTPPRHVDEGLRGIRRDLVDIGLFEEMQDGRINMPDVYRIGFGLGRLGGVPPAR